MAEAQPLHRNAQRAQEALAAAGVLAEVRQLADSARTSVEAAAALGVQVGQIAKSLVFVADGAPVVVIASGPDRVDLALTAKALGAASVSRADADAVRAATGYPIGGVSPAGLPDGLAVLVDRGLAAYEVVWAAAGTPHTVYPTNFAELLHVTGGRAVDVREQGRRASAPGATT
ncbi:MAG TPA: YbaK/EbsC family protein [Acidimicrobiales bacterium]|nr:YbaK/EbsC family protein [Acidimicrobiales bacterium]